MWRRWSVHHHPTRAQTSFDLAAIVYLGNILAHRSNIGSGGDSLPRELDPVVLEYFHLNELVLAELGDSLLFKRLEIESVCRRRGVRPGSAAIVELSMTTTEPTCYRLGRKGSLWASFAPGRHGLRPTWQIAVSARNRGGAKIVAPLLETSVLRPLATVTIKGEAYPLTIDWHEAGRGGGLHFGGARKLGLDAGTLEWEMRWLPLPGDEGCFRAEMRVRTTPRRTGAIRLELPVSLYQPEIWSLPLPSACQGAAWSAWSPYHSHFVGLIAPPGGAAEWAEPGGFALDLPAGSLGGGKLIAFGLRFGAASAAGDARAALVTQAAAWAGSACPPLAEVSALDPALAVARLTSPDAYDMQGMERLYLKPPDGEAGHYAGYPHEPAGALKALWDRNRLDAVPGIPRLVRFGARGLCADFQVMGRAGEAEPNKGAFWDKLTGGVGTDFANGPTHGLLSNARLARSLFLLHEETREPLLSQSALNICQWLLLKQNEEGFYDGARVHATRGLAGDGRFLPQPCSLDGAEAIRAFVLAYRATQNEVWIKAAWKAANFLLNGRLREFDVQSPVTVAGVILSLLALDAEAPNPRLRLALREWGCWLRLLPLCPDKPSLNADGFHAGLYDCAQAGFALFGLTRDLADLRYAFAALNLVPDTSRAASWRSVAAHQAALLSLAGLLPDSKLDFDAPSVTLDWRVFAPDPAAAPFLRVQPAGGPSDGIWAEWLPLVCRATDQLLLLVLAPPAVDAITVWKNNKRPLVRDLRTGTLDTDTRLAPLAKDQPWARIGLFSVDP